MGDVDIERTIGLILTSSAYARDEKAGVYILEVNDGQLKRNHWTGRDEGDTTLLDKKVWKNSSAAYLVWDENTSRQVSQNVVLINFVPGVGFGIEF
jgi:hypothetical protein